MRMLEGDLTTKELKRIFKKIQVNPETGCWIWMGSRDYFGYGMVWFRRRVERIHRVLYAWRYGPIPTGVEACREAQLDHVVCQNKSCCNPDHLEMVSHRTNVLRGPSPPAVNARKTHCKCGHPLPEGKRGRCPICDSERHKARLQGPDREYWKEKSRKASKRYYWKHKTSW